MPSRNGPLPRAQGDAAERDRLPRAIAARLARTGWASTPRAEGLPSSDARASAHGPLQAAGGADDAGPADPNR